jgi:DNA polymerase-4
VSTVHVEKSIGAEVTFDTDVADPAVIKRALLELSTKVGVRLRQADQAGRTVSIKVRLADFRTVNRSRTMGTPTDVAREIFSTAWGLYQALSPGDRVRLVGVRVEGLAGASGATRQPELGAPEHGWREAEAAADAAAARFGRSVVRPASLLTGERREIRPRPSVVPLSDPRSPS